MSKNPEFPLCCKAKPQKRDLENGSLIVTNPMKNDLKTMTHSLAHGILSQVYDLKESLHSLVVEMRMFAPYRSYI